MSFYWVQEFSKGKFHRNGPYSSEEAAEEAARLSCYRAEGKEPKLHIEHQRVRVTYHRIKEVRSLRAQALIDVIEKSMFEGFTNGQ